MLEHVRAGRTNPEIASILGVSSNTVKTQVSSMLGKLALENRTQLASWRGVPAEASRVSAGRLQMVGPVAWVWRHASTAAGALAAGAGAISAVVLFLVAMQGANETGGASGGSPEVATPTPTAATAEPSPVVPVDPAVVAPPVQLDGEFLVVVLPNTQSEQGPSHIERVTVADGSVVGQDTVLDPAEIAMPGAYLNTWRNIHYPPRAAGDVVVATICLRASCGGLGPADPAAETMLVRSVDGGATWEVLDTLDGAYWVWSWSADGSEVVLWRYPSGPGQGAWELVQWPGLSNVSGPAVPGVAIAPQRPPIVLGGGDLAWWTESGLIDGRGRLLLDFADLDASPSEVFEASINPDATRLVLTWSEGGPWRWTLFERDATGTFEPLRTLEQPAELSHSVPYSWLDADRVLIPANGPAFGFPSDLRVGYIPAVVDFQTGDVAPVMGFETPEIAQRGNLVIRVEPH